MSTIEHNRQSIHRLRAALYDIDSARLPGQLSDIFAPDATIHLAHPFEDLAGADELYGKAYRPLLAAIPDLERRDFICIAGESGGVEWVGCAGHYTGILARPWLGIPPTRRPVTMRYHEFFRMDAGRIVEMQAIWDIPQVMMQANAWPLAPSLGVEWVVPGPATQDGIATTAQDPAVAAANRQLVLDMLTAMGRHPLEGGPEVMRLERY